MNTYDTFCETRKCRATFIQQAENWEGAMQGLKRAGWYVQEHDQGAVSHCPVHAPRAIDTTRELGRGGAGGGAS